MNKKLIVMITSALLIFCFAIGINYYNSRQASKYGFLAKENAATFVRDYSPTYGKDDAKVYLVKFTDPGCETCRAFHPFVKSLMAAYPGKIKLVLRYTPFHEGADYMVKILEAAREQGKFWETLELMYNTQDHWASHHDPKPQLIWRYLPQVGLDVEKIRGDMYDPEIARRIRQDLADANTLNVRKTPGFFVNGKPLTEFGRRQLKELVESQIQEVY